MLSEFNGLKAAQKLLLIVVCLLGAGSAAAGFVAALHRSQDFQWSGEHILLQHVDPWSVYLRGNPDHQILYTQNPVYLAEFYVLTVPIGLFREPVAAGVWAFSNLCFAITSAWLAARFYRFARWQVPVIVGLFLMATPTRNTVGNGQQGLFVLFFWCLSLLGPELSSARAAIAGLSYFKMNYAPPTFLYLLMRGGLRAAAWSAVPALLSSVLVWLWISGIHSFASLVKVTLEPIQVARTGYFPVGGESNLMDVLLSFLTLFHLSQAAMDGLGLLAAIGITLAVLFVATRRAGTSLQWQMALFGTLSFAMFRHHAYDGVTLLFPFCYCLRFLRTRRGQAGVLLLSFVWYILRVIDAFKVKIAYDYIGLFAMLAVVLVLVFQLQREEQNFAMGWEPVTAPAG